MPCCNHLLGNTIRYNTVQYNTCSSHQSSIINRQSAISSHINTHTYSFLHSYSTHPPTHPPIRPFWIFQLPWIIDWHNIFCSRKIANSSFLLQSHYNAPAVLTISSLVGKLRISQILESLFSPLIFVQLTLRSVVLIERTKRGYFGALLF